MQVLLFYCLAAIGTIYVERCWKNEQYIVKIIIPKKFWEIGKPCLSLAWCLINAH